MARRRTTTRKPETEKEETGKGKNNEPNNEKKETGNVKTNFKWSFEFSLLNSAGKEVEKVNSTVETVEDNESEAFRAALKLAKAKYKTDRLFYTQNFKRIEL